jgi:membrane associated rhomboid family serine protease
VGFRRALSRGVPVLLVAWGIGNIIWGLTRGADGVAERQVVAGIVSAVVGAALIPLVAWLHRLEDERRARYERERGTR